MSDSPDFYISEIRGDRFNDFCVHTARFSGNRLQKVSRLEKIGQWDHGIKCLQFVFMPWSHCPIFEKSGPPQKFGKSGLK